MTPGLLLALVAAAAPALAPPAATWKVTGKPGAVTLLVGQVKSGGRLVADGFVSQADLVDDERGSLTQSPAPHDSCTWAKGVRPFTRLRRFAADGRLLWEWHVDREQQALRLASSLDADCLSPDGSRLTVEIFHYAPDDPVTSMGRSVVAVDHRPRFVAGHGVRTHEDINDRDADFTGWKRGRPATLLFDVVSDEGKTVVHDEAVMNGPRKP
jgi:hypothetical protein